MTDAAQSSETKIAAEAAGESADSVTFKKRKRGKAARQSTITTLGEESEPAAKKSRLESEDGEGKDSEMDPLDPDSSSSSSSSSSASAPPKDADEQIEQTDGSSKPVVWKKPKKQKDVAVGGSTRKRELVDSVDEPIYNSDRTVAPNTATQDHRHTVEVEREKSSATKKSRWVGPAKPTANNVRIISRFDYQPDLCKDYKETGYCGFGDSCKFMHDRGDYKSGWQLEKDFAEEQNNKKKRALGQEVEGEEDYRIKEDDDLPFACYICRNGFTKPVMTRCKHYFCEPCALKRFTKDTKCAACGEQTYGIFNTATRLVQVLEKRKKLEEAEAAGGGAGAGKDNDRLEHGSEGWVIPRG